MVVKNRKVRTGKVVSNKMDKSVIVTVEMSYKHPIYQKIVRKTRKFMAHDSKNECNIGDIVCIVETRPISKKKCWRISEIVEKAK